MQNNCFKNSLTKEAEEITCFHQIIESCSLEYTSKDIQSIHLPEQVQGTLRGCSEYFSQMFLNIFVLNNSMFFSSTFQRLSILLFLTSFSVYISSCDNLFLSVAPFLPPLLPWLFNQFCPNVYAVCFVPFISFCIKNLLFSSAYFKTISSSFMTKQLLVSFKASHSVKKFCNVVNNID